MGLPLIAASKGSTASIVELVGPAGVGKTSISAELCKRDRRIRSDLKISRMSYVKDAPALVPTFIRFHHPFRSVLQKEMKRVLYLTTLYRLVKLAQARGYDPVVFDEGPVYMLSRMMFLGRQAPINHAYEHWRRTEISRWARALHLIVWLDADTPTLVNRIRARPGKPPIADTRDDVLRPFLEGYRATYRHVIDALAAERGTAVLAINTSRTPVEAIAGRILAAMGRS